MANLIWEFRYILIVLFGLVIFALFEWEKFKSLAYKTMLQAKTLAKDAILLSGQEQEDWVVDKLYLIMPISFRVLINRNFLRKIVKSVYHKAKDYLDDGKINGSC